MKFQINKTNQIGGTVMAPPSKSYTHRAFFLACLSPGESLLKNPLYSEDTLATLLACEAWGGSFQVSDELCIMQGLGGELITPPDVLDLKNSGTSLRLGTTMASLAPGYSVLTGDESLRTRPMQPLLDALKMLGVDAFSTRNNGMAPLIIKPGFQGGKASIKGDVSSQFISSLLISAPYAESTVELEVTGNFISRPYVEMTLDIMEKFGVKVEVDDNHFYVENQSYHPGEYTVEGDYSSASYLAAAAAITESKVRIQNLFRDSQQGDKIILDILDKMGASVTRNKTEVIVEGPHKLEGVTVNLENSPDLVPTVAVLGALAQGETRIKGVKHARFKETDRLATTHEELVKLGVQIKETEDGLIIKGHPETIKGGSVVSHGDHRLAMSLSLVGLKTGNLVVDDAEAYKVSFPRYVEVMGKLGCKIEVFK